MPSQGWDTVVDDRSTNNGDQTVVASTSSQSLQQQADMWLQNIATAGEEVQELIMRDLVGREGFQNA